MPTDTDIEKQMNAMWGDKARGNASRVAADWFTSEKHSMFIHGGYTRERIQSAGQGLSS